MCGVGCTSSQWVNTILKGLPCFLVPPLCEETARSPSSDARTLIFDVPDSRTVRHQFLFFISDPVCGTLFQQHNTSSDNPAFYHSSNSWEGWPKMIKSGWCERQGKLKKIKEATKIHANNLILRSHWQTSCRAGESGAGPIILSRLTVAEGYSKKSI